jgi:hypothetical protein
MKKTVLTFGLLSGAVSAVMMLVTVPFVDAIGFDRGVIVGYTIFVLSLLFVYFGIRSYRDNVGRGTISFGQGFAVGILITLISCVIYVVAWELIYFNFMPDFPERFGEHYVTKLRAAGATPEAIDTAAREMKDFVTMYKNPLVVAAYSFLEPFPIGLLMTTISAAVLRRKASDQRGR